MHKAHHHFVNRTLAIVSHVCPDLVRPATNDYKFYRFDLVGDPFELELPVEAAHFASIVLLHHFLY